MFLCLLRVYYTVGFGEREPDKATYERERDRKKTVSLVAVDIIINNNNNIT